MNFLAPLFLIGALAVAGPVVYHLVRRTTRERLPFGSLIFLQPSPPRLSQRHRFEHILLLLLRCIALALLAFAFARPFLPGTPDDDPATARPARTVILIDTSASMRREGLWPAAVTRAGEWIRRAGPADELTLMTFNRSTATVLSAEEWRRVAAGERAALATSRLTSINPGWGATRLGSALAAAAEVLADADGKSAPGPRRIILVSDLQAGSRLETLQAYEWPKGVELFLESLVAQKTTNAGLQVLADGPEVMRPADAPARVRVTNSADAKREQFQIGWAGIPAPRASTPTYPRGKAGYFSCRGPRSGRRTRSLSSATTRNSTTAPSQSPRCNSAPGWSGWGVTTPPTRGSLSSFSGARSWKPRGPPCRFPHAPPEPARIPRNSPRPR